MKRRLIQKPQISKDKVSLIKTNKDRILFASNKLKQAKTRPLLHLTSLKNNILLPSQNISKNESKKLDVFG
jgi:hypothetical protein